MTAAGAFVATVAVGFALLPGVSTTYWGGQFHDAGRISPPDTEIYNQSLRGALVRLSASGAAPPGWLWPLLALLASAAAMAIAVAASRRGAELAGVLACALAALLVSPVSWHTHWTWCVPLLLLLAHRAARTRRAGPTIAAALVWLVFTGSGAWIVIELAGGLPGLDFRAGPTFLLGNLYLLLTPVLLVLLSRWADQPSEER